MINKWWRTQYMDISAPGNTWTSQRQAVHRRLSARSLSVPNAAVATSWQEPPAAVLLGPGQTWESSSSSSPTWVKKLGKDYSTCLMHSCHYAPPALNLLRFVQPRGPVEAQDIHMDIHLNRSSALPNSKHVQQQQLPYLVREYLPLCSWHRLPPWPVC